MNQRLDPAHPYRKYWVCSCEEINSEEVNICGGCGGSLIGWARSMLIPVAGPDDVRKLVEFVRRIAPMLGSDEDEAWQALKPFKEMK